MKVFRKIFKVLMVVVIVLLVGLGAIIVYAVISDYKPGEKEIIFTGDKTETMSDTMAFSIITWNIGYCGLDKRHGFLL